MTKICFPSPKVLTPAQTATHCVASGVSLTGSTCPGGQQEQGKKSHGGGIILLVESESNLFHPPCCLLVALLPPCCLLHSKQGKSLASTAQRLATCLPGTAMLTAVHLRCSARDYIQPRLKFCQIDSRVYPQEIASHHFTRHPFRD